MLMKLNEVIDIERIRKAKSRKDPMLAMRDKLPYVKDGDLGVESRVYKHKKHPNIVTKVALVASKETPYVKFIETILQHQDNPFFPRIYNAKLIERPPDEEEDWRKDLYDEPDQYLELFIQMEKLHSLKTGQLRETLPHIFKQIGVDFISPESLERAAHTVPGEDWEESASGQLFGAFETRQGRRQLIDKSKNPMFKEAMRVLEPHFEEFGADLNIGNIMVRLTNTGPQLVIIDPLYPQEMPFL